MDKQLNKVDAETKIKSKNFADKRRGAKYSSQTSQLDIKF